MKFSKRIVLVLSVTIFLFLPVTSSVSAEPASTLVVIRENTKQCAYILGGDECTECAPPDGWKILGDSNDVSCPLGYTIVKLDSVCTPLKNQFCCTQGHSGSAGNCSDLVINRYTEICSLVEDIETCNLPPGWLEKPADDPELDWVCPYSEDSWITNLDCQGGEADGEADTSIPVRIVSSLVTLGIALLCFSGSAVGVLLWVFRKKAQAQNSPTKE